MVTIPGAEQLPTLPAQVCNILIFPGNMIPYEILPVETAFAGLILASVLVIIAALFLTWLEPLELIPILSVIIDWLETLTSEWGVLIFLYLALSISVASGLIPVCTV